MINILIVVLGLVFLFIFFNKLPIAATEQPDPPNNNKPRVKPKPMNKLMPHFQELQFHNDYRDVMTAMNNLRPNTKKTFNLENKSVSNDENYSHQIVLDVIHDFIGEVNRQITELPDFRTKNSGWDSYLPAAPKTSGFEKSMEVLGLPGSVYSAPAPNAKIKLIMVNSASKSETETEIKLDIEFVVQKLNVEDQMVLKISFLANKSNYFKMVVEELFIVGYLCKHSTPLESKLCGLDADNQYCPFSETNQDNTLDDTKVQLALMAKYNRLHQDLNTFKRSLDEPNC